MRAARLLGINRKTLYRNLAKYKLADIEDRNFDPGTGTAM